MTYTEEVTRLSCELIDAHYRNIFSAVVSGGYPEIGIDRTIRIGSIEFSCKYVVATHHYQNDDCALVFLENNAPAWFATTQAQMLAYYALRRKRVYFIPMVDLKMQAITQWERYVRRRVVASTGYTAQFYAVPYALVEAFCYDIEYLGRPSAIEVPATDEIEAKLAEMLKPEPPPPPAPVKDFIPDEEKP